jgi:hypothetical protein
MIWLSLRAAPLRVDMKRPLSWRVADFLFVEKSLDQLEKGRYRL